MQLCLIHLDDALLRQKEFMTACEKRQARQDDLMSEGSRIRLWGKNADIAQVDSVVRRHFFADDNKTPRVCFMGSGDFHHMTALLLDAALDHAADPVTLLHFDNHPDWVHFKGGMHCGSWINRAAEHAQVAKIITVGVCSRDLHHPRFKGANLSLLDGKLELFPYSHAPKKWRTVAQMGEEAFAEHLLSRIPTQKVYVTVDKDVLRREDCETNWDQGVMTLAYLLSLIRRIGRQHEIIGADVTGDYSQPHYKGGLWTRLLKRGEILLDQPAPPASLEAAAALNGRANRALLETFFEVMS